jgi:1-acyl-sn-glycerol-3-phosphate acyltransferase
MILLRSVVYFAAMVVTVAFIGILLVLLGPLLGSGFVDKVANQWGRLNLWLQRVICGLGYRVTGAGHLPDGPCIVMSKHQSAWETIALRAILRPQQSWVLKRELMQIPVFGWCLKMAKSIPIDRSAGRRAVLKVVEDGTARLAEGRYVIIFPEGTRTAPGRRRKYGIGGGVLAQRSGATVIPIAHNAGVYWRRRGVKKYPGTIQMVIGPPISSVGKSATEITLEVETWIEEQQEKLPGKGIIKKVTTH